jgi:hypothetical protein
MARQSRFLRISANVADAVREMLFVAHEAIKIVALPKVAGSIEELVNFARGKTLPTLNQFLQRPCQVLNEQGVYMVRHHYGRDHDHALALEIPKRFGDDLRAVTSAQQT